MNLMTSLLAQAPAEGGEGWGSVIALIVIIWIIAAIYNAMTKPKEYDISLQGKARERR